MAAEHKIAGAGRGATDSECYMRLGTARDGAARQTHLRTIGEDHGLAVPDTGNRHGLGGLVDHGRYFVPVDSDIHQQMIVEP